MKWANVIPQSPPPPPPPKKKKKKKSNNHHLASWIFLGDGEQARFHGFDWTLVSVLFVRLFDLCLFGFVGFLFLLGSSKGCGLWLWHSLDFSLTFFFRYSIMKPHVIPSDNTVQTFIFIAVKTPQTFICYGHPWACWSSASCFGTLLAFILLIPRFSCKPKLNW